MSTRRKHRPISISFSLAFVRVCEWAREPNKHTKPDPETLEEAEVHALKLGDVYILEKIEEIRAYYRLVDGTPTPRRPGATPEALKPVNVRPKAAREINVATHTDAFTGTKYSIVAKKPE
jgi:hypothetical protein